MENAQGTPMETSPNTSLTIPSRHENDTDFEVMQTPETSTSPNTEDSLPTIRRQKTRYQAQMEKRAVETETGEKEDNDDLSISNTQNADRIGIVPNDIDKSDETEISDVNKGKRSKNLDKSEISDKCDTTEPDTENISNKTDDSKFCTGKNGRNKGKGLASKNKVDAYMKQRGKIGNWMKLIVMEVQRNQKFLIPNKE